jgi:hypothetical protein
MNSDDRLVELVIDGDDMAFELLYARHVADALAFADGLLGSREEAEQAVRHSFAAAHAYLADGGRKTAFEPWLYTILDNHCLSVLQRRRGAEAQEGEAATVVDLEEWRRKRKLMGAALPIAPSAGFHDSVMTACGIGGGAASVAAAPLLGATLAKVAVVVLLAGGAGVAGDAVSDRGRAAGAGQAPPASAGAPDTDSRPGLVSQLSSLEGRADRWPRLPTRSPRRERRAAPVAGVGEVTAPPAAAPVGQPTAEGVGQAPAYAPSSPTPSGGLGLPAAKVPALAPDDGSHALRRLGERLEQGLPTLEERVKAGLPSVGELPPVKLPKLPGVAPPELDLPEVVDAPNVELPSIGGPPPVVGDDGDVPAAQSSPPA